MKRQTTLIALILISVYSQAQLAWLRLPDFPGRERFYPSAFSINGKGYMGLGIDSTFQHHNDWYEYNPATNSWSQKTSLPSTPRDHASSFVVNGFGYIIAGEKSTGALNEVWQYNPANDTWTQKSSLPVARENGAGFVIAGKIYYGTGYVGGSNRDDFYEFDPIGNAWTSKANVPGGVRAAGVGFSVGGKGYMGIGAFTNGTSYYTDFYEYNPTTNSWTPIADYPLLNGGASAYQSANAGFVLCGGLYQYSGITQNPYNLLHQYSPSTNTWTQVGSFPGLPRAFSGEFSIDKDIYIIAGSQSINGSDLIAGHTPFLNDFWKLAMVIDSVALAVDNNGEKNEKMLQIFPNPSHDYLTISTEVLNTLSRIRVYDIAGKLVDELTVSSQNTQLDISKLSSGTYYAELVNKNNEIFTGRFVKE